MIKKRIMEQEKEEHEEKQLNPHWNNYLQNKNRKKINSSKNKTIIFYVIIIILFFLLYKFITSFIQNTTKENNTQVDKLMNSSK